jgi:allophanate hydrolase
MSHPDSLLIPDLLDAYRSGRHSVAAVLQNLVARAAADAEHHVWITRFSAEQVLRHAAALPAPGSAAALDLPLYGIPFVIKDNIDLAGVPTTAACPDFAYTPERSATVVERLLAAGAIPLGKVNLDQFATGLVGVRSPYGACRNAVDPAFISGGSSAGSAVAVARGLASFALGTDTAGSGRVPAGFNNLIGLKPSLGRLSTRGVVPACRSLDCVSIFAQTCDDAGRVLEAASGYDGEDAYSRSLSHRPIPTVRFGVPRAEQLQFFGDRDYAGLFALAVRRFESLGGTPVEIDFEPFLAAARLLYEGPWVAERFAAVGDFIAAKPEAVHPVTRDIIGGGRVPAGFEVFRAQYRLRELLRASGAAWAKVDLILTPTAGTIHRIATVEADPFRANAQLGYYTNFVNFFDLAALAVPAGFRSDGLPFGVTLVGPHSTERALLAIGDRLHRAAVQTLGAGRQALPPPRVEPALLAPGYLPIAVCGAHMSGLALNHQLRDRGGYLLCATRSAPNYRLYALPGGPPQRPGLLRVAQGGAALELEVWALPTEQVGSFLAGIPVPLGLGQVELVDGTRVAGFLCESYATEGAADVTAFGGWRAYLERS